jgi:serine/threonine protein kinase
MPLRQNNDLDRHVDESEESDRLGSRAGATVQLGSDYFTYARERLSVGKFKEALVQKLQPTVPRRGRPHAIRPGESFGKFQILDRLGKGGMADVYQALDPERVQGEKGHGTGSLEARQSVALKVMKPEIALNPEYVRRFLREAANTALIDHPNVVTVLEVGSVAGRLYFTMELIEGMTLKEHLRDHDLTELEGVQILCQLVDGLVAAHECGIGHRDLKPANLMLVTSQARYGLGLKDEFDVVVKITDFGLAQQIDMDKSEVMRGGRFLGTAKYVAPEVVMGAEPTLKSDVFSLGIMAFTMFAGRSPFRARSKTEYIAANIQLEAPLLVDAMLRKDPKRRPEARALRRDLSRLQGRNDENERVHASGDPASVFNVRSPAEGTAPALPIPALVGAVVVVAVIVIAFLAFGGDRGGTVKRSGPGDSVPKDPPPEDPTVPDDPPPVRRKDPPVYTGDPLLEPIPVDRGAFGDRLAEAEFMEHLKAGDAAWQRGDKEAALEGWTEAAQRIKRQPKGLRRRVKTALKEVALKKGKAAEQRGALARALSHYDHALQSGVVDASLKERAERLRVTVAQGREYKTRLRRARVLGRSEATRDRAITELRDLLKLASILGLEDEIEKELSALGTPSGKQPSGSSGTETPSAVLSAEDEEWLKKANDLIGMQSYDAAEVAVRRVSGRSGETARTQAIESRIARGRRTPRGMEYYEAPAKAGEVPVAFFVAKAKVTNARFYRWFKVASVKTLIVPPSGWSGKSTPPGGSERGPVRGLRVATAELFAVDGSARVPTSEDAAHLKGVFSLEVADGGVFKDGFRLIRDAE